MLTSETWTWLCPGCGAKHVDCHASLDTCCACGAEWDPLTAPAEEVDAQLRAMGLDPAEVAARGLAVVRAARDGDGR